MFSPFPAVTLPALYNHLNHRTVSVLLFQACRLSLKCDGTGAETRYCLSPKRTSPFKSAGTSVQSTAGSRGVRISGSNAGYTTFRGSVWVLATHSIRQFPLHFPSRASPCAIRFQTHSNPCGCRSHWPRGLRRGSAAAQLLGLPVRIPVGHGCLSFVRVVCCPVQVCASGWSAVQRSPTECGVSECDQEISTMRRPRLSRVCHYIKKNLC
jgi:hypothetical protein